jgi:hypothetical protein
MSSVTWACPNCKRRVPNRVSTCHCGTTRAQADQAAAAQQAASKRPVPRAWTPRPRPLPRAPLGRDVKLLLVGIFVVIVLAVVRMLLPWQPPAIYPVLGFSANAPTAAEDPPTPEPVGTPRPAPTSVVPTSEAR